MKRTNPRFPDYEIRDDGRVFRVRYGKSGIGSFTVFPTHPLDFQHWRGGDECT